MQVRLLIGLLLVAIAWQGQMLAVAGSLAPVDAPAAAHCRGQTPPDKGCDSCCPQISMASCASACTASIGMAAPPAQEAVQRVALPGETVPEVRMARPAHHVSPQPLRPPIVAALID